jgi:hypothetical protein
MLIGVEIQLIVGLQLDIVSSWAILLSLGVAKKQTVVARSSAESEYHAIADASSELIWLRWLLTDMGVPHSSATMLHCDNRSAIQISHNDVFHERTKHIEIDCHFSHNTIRLVSVSFRTTNN